jgi:cell division protein FtsQ
MNETSSLRQQKRREQRGQLNRSVLMGLLVVAVAAVTASQWPLVTEKFENSRQSFIQWTANQGFTIQKLEVTGRNQVPAADLMQALQVKKDTPILSYAPGDAVARLSTNPWLKSVNVERRMPDTVFVRVEERIPAARWQLHGKLAVVDVEGAVLTTENMDMYKDLPIIIGQEARHKVVDLFTLLRGEPELAKEITAATWISNRRWNLTLRNNVVIKLPANDPGLALSEFTALNASDKILERDITTVDLRLPKQVILQPTVRANALIERPDFSDTASAKKQEI